MMIIDEISYIKDMDSISGRHKHEERLSYDICQTLRTWYVSLEDTIMMKCQTFSTWNASLKVTNIKNNNHR